MIGHPLGRLKYTSWTLNPSTTVIVLSPRNLVVSEEPPTCSTFTEANSGLPRECFSALAFVGCTRHTFNADLTFSLMKPTEPFRALPANSRTN